MQSHDDPGSELLHLNRSSCYGDEEIVVVADSSRQYRHSAVTDEPSPSEALVPLDQQQEEGDQFLENEMSTLLCIPSIHRKRDLYWEKWNRTSPLRQQKYERKTLLSDRILKSPSVRSIQQEDLRLDKGVETPHCKTLMPLMPYPW